MEETKRARRGRYKDEGRDNDYNVCGPGGFAVTVRRVF